MDTIVFEEPTQRKRNLSGRIFTLILTVMVPFTLTMINVRLVMTTQFLELEYNRPGFPEDTFGFSTEDRLQYAPYALNYLLNDAGIEYLGDLTFPDGTSLYNDRELRHMADVKVITRAAFGLLTVAIGFLIVSLAISGWQPGLRQAVRQGLFYGAALTIAIIFGLVFLAVTAWDVFFTGFHQLLFESGTWRFYFSDTLIRLFPEQFWFDASVIIGGLTLLEAIILCVVAWNWGRRPVKISLERDSIAA